jgi:hypothetical protein
MQSNTVASAESQTPLRAIVEIVDGVLRIFPICQTDAEEHEIMDPLRFMREDFEG